MKKYLELIMRSPEYVGITKLCNICGFRFSRFLFYGLRPREAQCPLCKSLERHRHLYIHLAAIFPVLKNKKILHFAPENIIKSFLKESSAKYFDADIDESKASYQIDITSITFPEGFFDYIVCIHVLEHIPDDIQAMRELYRVLRPGGTAYLSVPLSKNFDEDLSITDGDLRAKLYGQADHVRNYNLATLLERLRTVGFNTERVSNPEQFPSNFKPMGLGDIIVLATKE